MRNRADRLARIDQLEREIRLDALEELAARLELTFYDMPALPKITEVLNAIRYDWGGDKPKVSTSILEDSMAGGGLAPSRPQG